jgi:hypothetical protein
LIVYAVDDDALSPDSRSAMHSRCLSAATTRSGPIAEVRADDPEVAEKLRIEEREFEAGGVN